LYPQWKNYVIKKPRLPTANDSAVNLIDEAKYRPVTLGGYIGDHNAEILKSLKLIVDNFGKSGNLPAVICLCGKSGTGKTSIVNSYMNELCAVIDIASEKQRKKFILQFVKIYYDYLHNIFELY
jgi:Holliday junction resolvasome RuvABC ATP-dependent DNA helicase subunit